MNFRPYDTKERKQVDFSPLHAGELRMYNCGPTVYGVPHIGNFRSFLFADLLRRHFERSGVKVTQVMNITDVGHLTEDDVADASGEDKLQKAAQEMGWDPFKVARHFEDLFHRDRKRLKIKDAHIYPRATDHVREMLVMIQKLLDAGHAYIPDDSGEVYYDLSSFPRYGELSNRKVDEMMAGARVEVDDKKRNPADFSLWKVDAGHLMQWDPHDDALWKGYEGERPAIDSRIHKGFPGWHVECSAMSIKYLGETFDIHTGGEDNIFPHHECEIAQSEGTTGKTFVRCWMHARYLLVDNKKMSKRAGTLFALDDLAAKGYRDKDTRFLILSNHYRAPMNFSLEALDGAHAAIDRLQNCRDLLSERAAGSSEQASDEIKALCEKMRVEFDAALDDDLNTPNALAALFTFVNEANRLQLAGSDANLALEALDDADSIFAVLERESRGGVVSKEDAEKVIAEHGTLDVDALLAQESHDAQSVTHLIAARFDARANKDWAKADAIRDALNAAKVVLEDTKEGVRYKLP